MSACKHFAVNNDVYAFIYHSGTYILPQELTHDLFSTLQIQ